MRLSVPLVPVPSGGVSREVSIRAATRSDVSRLMEGNRAMAWETEGLELDEATLRAGVEAVFNAPRRGRYFVAEDRGAVFGQLLITYEWSDWRNADVWWIQSVYVWPEHRGRGVYRSLSSHVEASARAEGAAGLRLYVDRRNEAAREVYRRLGMDGEHYLLFEKMFPV